MRRADFPSEAAYFRAHRKVFLLAQELGCTPVEAERRMKDEEARMHHLSAQARLAAKRSARPTPGMSELATIRSGHDPEERREQWWQQ